MFYSSSNSRLLRYQFRNEISTNSLHRQDEITSNLSGSAKSSDFCSQKGGINVGIKSQFKTAQRPLIFSPIPTQSYINMSNQKHNSSSVIITRSNGSPRAQSRDRIMGTTNLANSASREIFSPSSRKTDRSQSSPRKNYNPFNVVSSSSMLSRSEEYSRGESTVGSSSKIQQVDTGVLAMFDSEKCDSPRLKSPNWIAHEILPTNFVLCNARYAASEPANVPSRGDSIIRTLSNDECMTPRLKK
jgi:hypothetical protein